MNAKLQQLKDICKTQAADLKQLTVEIKKLQRAGSYAGLLQQQQVLSKLQYRRNHIAYSLLRGKLYDQIEKPKHDNKKLSQYDWEQIEKIRSAYYEQVAETLCSLS